jgi:hypothetical protein
MGGLIEGLHGILLPLTTEPLVAQWKILFIDTFGGLRAAFFSGA